MTGTLRIAAILCALVATADAGHGGRGGGGGGGAVVRDHRAGGGGGGGGFVRDHRAGPVATSRGPVVRDHRGPGPVAHVRVSNGRYFFPGGVVRVYHRPVIRTHYYNIHARPALIVEPYDPVPGYVWVHGGWTWGGGEWVWTPGYFAEGAAEVSGGVNVSAGISIH